MKPLEEILSSAKPDHRLVRSLKKSLQKRCKLSTDDSQVKLLHLSVYLLALGDDETSASLSEYIVAGTQPTNNKNILHSVGLQKLMCARRERLTGNIKCSHALAREVQRNDIMSKRKSRKYFFDEDLADLSSALVKMDGWTPKWKCEGYSTTFQRFNYYRELIEVDPYDDKYRVVALAEPVLEQMMSRLIENLK